MDVVTGAFSFTGRYIANQLLAAGAEVKTLTGHHNRPNPFGKQVVVAPYSFDDPRALAASLRGARTLYNTYWIRFPHRDVTFATAVANSRALIAAAEAAGVRRIVHISIANPRRDSRLPYYHGKALVEEAVMASGMSHAIIRPTVLFGPGDILINNIAWLLRRFPLFAVPGRGDYQLQPVFVEDVAQLAVELGRREDNVVVDAAGPEVYAFADLVRLIARAVGSRARLLSVPPPLALRLSGLIGRLVGDVVLTADEVAGLLANLLVAQGPATGQTRFSQWLAQNAGTVGTAYASELARHYR